MIKQLEDAPRIDEDQTSQKTIDTFWELTYKTFNIKRSKLSKNW